MPSEPKTKYYEMSVVPSGRGADPSTASTLARGATVGVILANAGQAASGGEQQSGHLFDGEERCGRAGL